MNAHQLPLKMSQITCLRREGHDIEMRNKYSFEHYRERALP